MTAGNAFPPAHRGTENAVEKRGLGGLGDSYSGREGAGRGVGQSQQAE